VEYSVFFAVLVLPLTYWPVLKLADDRAEMGEHVNAGIIRVLGWAYLVLICVVAVAAVPLMAITHNGQG
jgi:Mn2+/Fe2+ NRAMP family transporter